MAFYTFSILSILLLVQTVVGQNQKNCNVTLTLKEQDKNGFILKNYFNDEVVTDSCWYIVKSLNPDFGIRVEYEKVLALKNSNCSEECCEFLDIGDGTKLNQNLKSSRCVSAKIDPEIFDSNAIWLNFRTVKSLLAMLKFSPFKLTYKEPSGFISSPEKKNFYLNNLNLTYKILVKEDQLVYLRFSGFSVESYNDTCIDYLEIGAISSANQTNSSAITSNKYCGLQIPSQIYIYSNQIYLRFFTDSSEVLTGFNVYYNTIKYLFTEPTGNIISSDYPINITYIIRAPDNQKIELLISEFEFSSCNVDETDRLVESPDSVCSKNNDYLMFTNQKGSIDTDFFDSMSKLSSDSNSKKSSDWIFCACNRPVRTYVSLTNELNIKYFLTPSLKNHRYGMNSFNIMYRFVPGEFNSNNNLRIIQDQMTSFIGGYFLNVLVPADNHLRIFGKSSKCVFPKYSILSRRKAEKTLQNVTLNQGQFKKNCSYLFDLSEPITNSNQNKTNFSDWKLIWFIKFENSSVVQDFEINWKFIKNKINDEKKPSLIELPAQTGFDITKDENDGVLMFQFKSSNQNRKYELDFSSDKPIMNSKFSGYVKIDLMNNKPELHVPNSYLNNKDSTPFILESKMSILKIKRSNKFSMEIKYNLGSQFGDCDFDTSFCDYTVDPEQQEPELNQDNLLISHMSKYSSLNINYYNVLKMSKDFYMSVLKSNQDSGYIYSPLINLQKSTAPPKDKNQPIFNQKVYTISFSYMLHNRSDNIISLILMTNRSDIKVPIIHKEIIAEYSRKSLEFDQSVTALNIQNECPTPVTGSILNTFVLTNEEKKHKPATLLPSERAAVTLTSNDNEIRSKRNWYRVTKKIFSCFDFRFGFKFNFSEPKDLTGNEQTVNLNSASPIGIDDIELNYESHVSECEKEICGANGKCFKFEDKSVCCCNPGFEGETCERQVSPCDYIQLRNGDKDVCQNGGKCQNNLNEFDYSCDCSPGYSGKNCEYEINECEPVNPCKNNGRCLDLLGSFQCICKTGYSGKTCELKTEFCKDKCSAGTYKCLNDKSDAICICLPEYTGQDCSIKIKVDHCLSNPCANEATCESNLHGFKCVCPEDRTGKHCEQKIDYCNDHGHLCKNESVCIFASVDGSNVKCSCAAGFTGTFCNIPINECESNPCVTGTCVDLHLGYECVCPRGIFGRHCDQKPKNPCHKNMCVNGICVPDHEAGNYTCQCNHEATGEYCEKELCEKEKYLANSCHKTGTEDVITFEGACKCICKTGYSGKFCDKKQNPCELRAKIVDFDEECKNGGKCIYNNQTDEIKCLCKEGFFGDRCQIAENNCKEQCKYGLCKNEGNSYKCICTKGWKGKHCDEPLNQCSLQDCVIENTIEVLYSKQSCVCMCKLGFTGDRCQTNINDCEKNMCKNNATCVDLVASYDCVCPHGFAGPYCEKTVTSCSLNPCNNGTCEEIAGKAQCTCDRGFTGKFCDISIDKCNPNPCENKGVCHNLIDDYYCACLPEFGNSKNCTERLVDPCLSAPCYNDATCSAVTVSSGTHKNKIVYQNFTCRCKSGFKGEFCEITTDPCSSNPCSNRGNCVVLRGTEDYACRCYPSFTGKNCETYFDPCLASENICKNGGSCLATPEGYKCKCPTTYGGENCEILKKPCDMMQCLNGGSCVIENDIPSCVCPSIRYIGTRCEIDISKIKYKSKNSALVKSAAIESGEPISCDILGNNTGPINYLFAFVILIAIAIAIVVIAYMYVRYSIKKVKKNALKQQEQENSEEFNNTRRYS